MCRITGTLIALAMVLLPGVPLAVPVTADDSGGNGMYTTRHTDPRGKAVYCDTVPGSPPPGNMLESGVQAMGPGAVEGVVLADVPAFNWCYGCSPAAAGMLAGYYDQPSRGYVNIYSGPSNGGVCPLNNELWWGNEPYPDLCDIAVDCGSCPLVATRKGLDGRSSRGHVDDYWRAYYCGGDAYFDNWAEHSHDSLADFMGTSQWARYETGFPNYDGFTSFWYLPGNVPTYDYTGMEPLSRDGCHGIRLFLELRGYPVSCNFNQRIYGFGGIPAGFTYAQYRAEINAGRPVIIQLTGHTLLGTGYNDSGDRIYIHDTWDHKRHVMAWGGAYYGMQHRGVTVVRLAPPPPRLVSASAGSGTPSSLTLNWGPVPGTEQYRLEVSSSPLFTGQPLYQGEVNGTGRTVTLPVQPGSTCYWRVFACDESGIWGAPSKTGKFTCGRSTSMVGTSIPPASGSGLPDVQVYLPPPPMPLPPVSMDTSATSAAAEDGNGATADDGLLVFSSAMLTGAGLLCIVVLWRKMRHR